MAHEPIVSRISDRHGDMTNRIQNLGRRARRRNVRHTCAVEEDDGDVGECGDEG